MKREAIAIGISMNVPIRLRQVKAVTNVFIGFRRFLCLIRFNIRNVFSEALASMIRSRPSPIVVKVAHSATVDELNMSFKYFSKYLS